MDAAYKVKAKIQALQDQISMLQEVLLDIEKGSAPATEVKAKAKPGPKPKASPAVTEEPKVKKGRKPNASKILPDPEMVLAAVNGGGKGTTAIAEEIGFDKLLTHSVVKQLVADGKLTQTGGGRWTVYSRA
jgi:hypothetical protein